MPVRTNLVLCWGFSYVEALSNPQHWLFCSDFPSVVLRENLDKSFIDAFDWKQECFSESLWNHILTHILEFLYIKCSYKIHNMLKNIIMSSILFGGERIWLQEGENNSTP